MVGKSSGLHCAETKGAKNRSGSIKPWSIIALAAALLIVGFLLFMNNPPLQESRTSQQLYGLAIGDGLPSVDFISPTPADGATITDPRVTIAAIVEDTLPQQVSFTWDGTTTKYLDSGLILMFNFDQVSSLGETTTTVMDMSGHSNDGSINGDGFMNLTGTNPRYHGAFQADGDGDYIELASDPTAGKNAVSVEAWINFGTGMTRSIAGAWSSDSDMSSLLFTSSDNTALFRVRTNQGYTTVRSAVPVQDRSWHHVVGVYTGTEVQLYVDGLPSGTFMPLTGSIKTPLPSTLYRIGLYGGNNATSPRGQIDEFRVWDRALTPEEIRGHSTGNLNKQSQDQWLFTITPNNMVDQGTYTYQASMTDHSGIVQTTETRTMTANLANYLLCTNELMDTALGEQGIDCNKPGEGPCTRECPFYVRESHPRMYITNETLPILRCRIGIAGYESYCGTEFGFFSIPYNRMKDEYYKNIRQNDKNYRRLVPLSFVCLIDNNASFCDHAKVVADANPYNASYVWFFGGSSNMGIFYDWAHHSFTEEERQRFQGYVFSVVDPNGAGFTTDPLVAGDPVEASWPAAIFGESEDDTFVFKSINSSFAILSQRQIPVFDEMTPGGCYVNYFKQGTYMFYHAALFSTATDQNLFSSSSFMTNHGRFYLANMRNDGKQQDTFGKYNPQSLSQHGYVFTSAYDDPYVKYAMDYYWGQLNTIENFEGSKVYDNIYSILNAFIFYNTNQASEPFDDLPHSFTCTDLGLMISKTSTELPDQGFDGDIHAVFFNGQKTGESSTGSQNHFVISRGDDPLIIHGATYGRDQSCSSNYDFFSNWFGKTISYNGLLVYNPEEDHFPLDNDGGSTSPGNIDLGRIHYPIYSSFATAPYRGMISRNEEQAQFTYARGDDAELAYPNKVTEWTREFVHILPDVFVIFDRVEVLNASWNKSVILHTVWQPHLNGDEQRLEGSMYGGIWESTNSNTFHADYDSSRIFVRTLLPVNKIERRIGGANANNKSLVQNWKPEDISTYDPSTSYEWYYAGKNNAPGPNTPEGGTCLDENTREYRNVYHSQYNNKGSVSPFGDWRVEIQSLNHQNRDYFLNVLQPTATTQQTMIPTILLESQEGNAAGVLVNNTKVVLFAKTDQVDTATFNIPASGTVDFLFFGLAPNAGFSVTKNGNTVAISPGSQYHASDQGVLAFALAMNEPAHCTNAIMDSSLGEQGIDCNKPGEGPCTRECPFYVRMDHPRLFITPESLEQRQCYFGISGHTSCAEPGALATQYQWFRSLNIGQTSNQVIYLPAMSFICMIEGGTACTRAREIADTEMTLWEGGGGTPRESGGGVGSMPPMSFFFDWMYSTLTPQERQYYGRYLIDGTIVQMNEDEPADATMRPYWMHCYYPAYPASVYGEGINDTAAFIGLNMSYYYYKNVHVPVLNELSPEGCMRGYGNTLCGMTTYAELFQTALGENFYNQSQFVPNAGKALLYRMRNDRVLADDPDKYNPGESYIFIALYAARSQDPYVQRIAKYWLDHPTLYSSPRAFIPTLLVYDPTLTPASSFDDLSQSYMCQNTGILYMKDIHKLYNESYEGDIHAGFFNGPWMVADEGGQNHFTIARGNDILAIHGANYGNPQGLTDAAYYYPNWFSQSISYNSLRVTNPLETYGSYSTCGGAVHIPYGNDGGATSTGDLLQGNVHYPITNNFASIDLRYRGSFSRYEDIERYVYARGSEANYSYPNKIKEWTREFVFLSPDVFVLFDRAEALDPTWNKTITLHTVNAPTTNGIETQLTGSQYGGIFESTDATQFFADRGTSRLFVNTILPQAKIIRRVGGANANNRSMVQNWRLNDDYSYDPSTSYEWYYDGKNNVPGPVHTCESRVDMINYTDTFRNSRNNPSANPAGDWRIEVQSLNHTLRDYFLQVLWPTSINQTTMIPTTLLESTDGNAAGVLINNTRAVLFAKTDQVTGATFNIAATGSIDFLFFGLTPNAGFSVTKNGNTVSISPGSQYHASNQGVLSFNLTMSGEDCTPQPGLNNYYVDIESLCGPCSDSNAGTNIVQPWCTINKAMLSLTAGETAYVMPGTYPLNASGTTELHPADAGLPEARISLVGLSSAKETVGRPEIYDESTLVFITGSPLIVDKSYWTIDGVFFKNASGINCKNNEGFIWKNSLSFLEPVWNNPSIPKLGGAKYTPAFSNCDGFIIDNVESYSIVTYHENCASYQTTGSVLSVSEDCSDYIIKNSIFYGSRNTHDLRGSNFSIINNTFFGGQEHIGGLTKDSFDWVFIDNRILPGPGQEYWLEFKPLNTNCYDPPHIKNGLIVNNLFFSGPVVKFSTSGVADYNGCGDNMIGQIGNITLRNNLRVSLNWSSGSVFAGNNNLDVHAIDSDYNVFWNVFPRAEWPGQPEVYYWSIFKSRNNDYWQSFTLAEWQTQTEFPQITQDTHSIHNFTRNSQGIDPGFGTSLLQYSSLWLQNYYGSVRVQDVMPEAGCPATFYSNFQYPYRMNLLLNYTLKVDSPIRSYHGDSRYGEGRIGPSWIYGDEYVPIACNDDCSTNQQQCIGDLVQSCGENDLDFCLDWLNPVSCGITSCNANIHLQGSCSNTCGGSQCQSCTPSCSCANGWSDADNNLVNGCELLLPPQASFVSPTPSNGATVPSFGMNVSVTSNALSSVSFGLNANSIPLMSDDLVLLVNFDNRAALGEFSNVVKDMSASGLTGSVVTSTWSGQGKFGGAYSFTNGQVDFGDNLDMGLDSFTVLAWIKAPVGATWRTLIDKRINSAGSDGYGLRLTNDGLVNALLGAGSQVTYDAYSAARVDDDSWHYIAVVYDRSGLMKIYIDGVLDGSVSISGESAYAVSNSLPLFIGKGRDIYPFVGIIDEVRIWKRALTTNEIVQQYRLNLNKVDADNWSAWFMNPTLPPGPYTYEVSAVDASENTATSGIRTVIIGTQSDATPPTVWNLQARPSTVPVGTLVNLSANVTDAESGVQSVIIEVDGLVNYTTVASSNEYYTTSAATGIVGPYTYRVYASDNAGNVNRGMTDEFTVVDTTLPTSNHPDNYAYQIGSLGTIDWILQDNYLPGKYTVTRNGTIQNNTLSWVNDQNLRVAVYTGAVGNYTYVITFNDSSGNVGQDSVYIVITASVPDNNPVVILDSPINGSTSSNGSVTFKCNATDDNLLLNLTLYHNVSGWTPVLTTTTSPLVFTAALLNGTYAWSCLAYDNASQKAWGENQTLFVAIHACLENWTCTGFSQTTCGDRTCTDQNSCGTASNKPAEHIDCSTPSPNRGGSPLVFKGGGSPTFGKLDILRNITAKKLCEDGLDNEGGSANGCTDGKDALCGGIEKYCTGGIDNDCDGMTDCADPDCRDDTHCQTEQNESTPEPVYTLADALSRIFLETPRNQTNATTSFESVAEVQGYFGFLNWMILGILATLFLGLIGVQHLQTAKQTRVSSTTLDSLTNYIKNQLAKGTSPDVIRQRLKSAGWIDEVIDHELQRIQNEQNTIPSHT